MATIHFLLSLDLEFFFNSFFRDKFWKFDFGMSVRVKWPLASALFSELLTRAGATCCPY
jgi:hypothetical protein